MYSIKTTILNSALQTGFDNTFLLFCSVLQDQDRHLSPGTFLSTVSALQFISHYTLKTPARNQVFWITHYYLLILFISAV